MKVFDSPGKFAKFFLKTLATEVIAINAGLKTVGVLVEKTAKSEFGNYQSQQGPFSEWAPLADSTVDERIALGFTPDDPLLRTGETRDSISHTVDERKLEVVVGSTSDKMRWFEYGTEHMPERPVLGPAVFRNKKKIKAILAYAAFEGLVGKRGDIIARFEETTDDT